MISSSVSLKSTFILLVVFILTIVVLIRLHSKFKNVLDTKGWIAIFVLTFTFEIILGTVLRLIFL